MVEENFEIQISSMHQNERIFVCNKIYGKIFLVNAIKFQEKIRRFREKYYFSRIFRGIFIFQDIQDFLGGVGTMYRKFKSIPETSEKKARIRRMIIVKINTFFVWSLEQVRQFNRTFESSNTTSKALHLENKIPWKIKEDKLNFKFESALWIICRS